MQGVFSCVAVERIVAQTAGERIRNGVAIKGVILIRGLLNERFDLIDAQCRPVGEPDLFDRVGRSAVLTEVVRNAQAVVRPDEVDDQVFARAAQADFVRRDAFSQFDRVRIRPRSVSIVVIDRILAGADAEAVDIRSIAAVETVALRSALQRVVAVAAIERIVARAAGERVVPGFALHVVVAFSARELVIAQTAKKIVVAGLAVQGVIPGQSAHGIVTAQGVDEIVPGAAGKCIVAFGGVWQGGGGRFDLQLQYLLRRGAGLVGCRDVQADFTRCARWRDAG